MFTSTLVAFGQTRAIRLVFRQHISPGGINKDVALLDKFIASVIHDSEYIDVIFVGTPSSDLTYFDVLKGVVPLLRYLGQLVQESQDRLVPTPRSSDTGLCVAACDSRIRCFARSTSSF
jgi:hypothetical protein